MIEIIVASMLLGGMIGGVSVLVWRRLRRGEVRRMQISTILLLALVTSVLAYALWGFYAAILKHGWAEIFIQKGVHIWKDGIIVGDAVDQDLAEGWRVHAVGLRREIWVQMVIPGEGQRPCYTQDPAVCALLVYSWYYTPPTAEERWLVLALSLADGAACGATAWLLAGRRQGRGKGRPGAAPRSPRDESQG
jgi:hypothetical protein